jgi:hypothetical protein
MGNFPNQLMKKFPVEMNVGKISLSDLSFSYKEYNPLSQQTGAIDMDKLNLAVTNFSNTGTAPLVVEGRGLFMHQVPIQAEFVFDMASYQSGKFKAHIKVNGFDAGLVNSFAMPLGLMKIEKGHLSKAEASISGDQWKATGNVLVLYEDLKLSLLEKDKGNTALDKKDFTTLVANLFVLKKSNPKGKQTPRKEAGSFTRDPQGGFFMLVWKTMLVGILKTIGAPEKLAYKKPVGKK